jgi:hypothetical protein
MRIEMRKRDEKNTRRKKNRSQLTRSWRCTIDGPGRTELLFARTATCFSFFDYVLLADVCFFNKVERRNHSFR